MRVRCRADSSHKDDTMVMKRRGRGEAAEGEGWEGGAEERLARSTEEEEGVRMRIQLTRSTLSATA